MSHYAKITVKFADREALVESLMAMGWRRDQIEVNATPIHLYGYRGDERPEVADIIIRRDHVQSCANDIGFNTATGEIIISDYDHGNARTDALPSAQDAGGYNEAWVNNLKNAYTGIVVGKKVRELRAKGRSIRIAEDRREGTRRVITLEVG